MNEDAGFLQAICEDPYEDAVRLIYADWLQENGRQARGEFIQVQMDLKKQSSAFRGNEACSCTFCKLRRRERELLQEGCEYQGGTLPRFGWAGPTIAMRASFLEWEFRRGFVEQVACSCADWLQHGVAIVQSQPVLEVRLTDKRPSAHGTVYRWFDGIVYRENPDRLPDQFWRLLGFNVPGQRLMFKTYANASTALADLSHAAVAWARQRAGLPALSWCDR